MQMCVVVVGEVVLTLIFQVLFSVKVEDVKALTALKSIKPSVVVSLHFYNSSNHTLETACL
jgi:hypothetical protein